MRTGTGQNNYTLTRDYDRAHDRAEQFGGAEYCDLGPEMHKREQIGEDGHVIHAETPHVSLVPDVLNDAHGLL